MKKPWVIILAGVLAAAVLFLFWPQSLRLPPVAGRGLIDLLSLPRDLLRDRSPDSLIPARAGLMLRFRSMAAAWDRLAPSRTFRRLAASSLWREEGIGQDLQSARQDLESRLGFQLSRSRIMEVAGRDFALAIVPSGEAAAPALLVAAHLGLRARLAELALRLGDSLRDVSDRRTRQERYGGRTVVVIPPTANFPLEVAYTVIDGFLLAAVSDEPQSLVEEAVDLARGEGGSLIGLPEFSAALDGRGFPAVTSIEFYLNPDRLEKGIGRGLPPGPVAEAVAWGEVLAQSLQSCRMIGGRVGYRNGLHCRLRAVLKMDDDCSGAPSGSPIPLPAGGMLYGFFALDPVSAGEYISGLLSGLGVRFGQDFPGLSVWEEESGLSLRRAILPALGENWSLVLGGVTGEEFLPLPPFALVNRVSDPAAAKSVMNKVVSWAVLARGLSPVREIYRGVDLTSFPGLFFGEPGYALTGGELIVAGSRPMLKQMIDLGAAEVQSVESDPLFRRTVSELDEGAFALIYLEAEEFFASLRSVAEWYFAYQRLAPEEPLVSERAYRGKVIPLLKLLRPLSAAAASVTRQKNIVTTDCFLYIPGPDEGL